MNQDQIINWLFNNFDAEAYLESKRNGTAFTYLAGIAQTFPGDTQTPRAVNRPATRTAPAPAQRTAPAPAPRRVEETATDLNAEEEAPAPVRRQTTNRNTNQNQNANRDRVRVGNL